MVTVTGGTAVALSVICLPFVLPAIRRVCLPYVPATATQIRNVMHALAGRTGRLVDLGSGDGRIVSSWILQIMLCCISGMIYSLVLTLSTGYRISSPTQN
jgi:hypothetical protein